VSRCWEGTAETSGRGYRALAVLYWLRGVQQRAPWSKVLNLWVLYVSDSCWKVNTMYMYVCMYVYIFIRYDLKMRMQVFLLRRGVLKSPSRFPVPCGTLSLADVCNQKRRRRRHWTRDRD
jgi:hypothetical protein